LGVYLEFCGKINFGSYIPNIATTAGVPRTYLHGEDPKIPGIVKKN